MKYSYHLEAKVITRGTGRSAVAAAAYMSCSCIYNDYDGITHDYTRKRGLVWEQIFLPEHAPREWSDRSVLWNAVEASEKSKDSRLARELIVALPKELSQETNEFLLQYFIEKECAAKGMCAHVCYLRNKYLSHLNYVVMVDSRTLIPERLGGADFDGDMVKTIADPLLNECVTRNYKEDDFDPFSHQSNIPLLKIPSAEPIIRDANDWQARFEAVKSTFSSRIGQICNAAFDRSIIAYDENSTAAERNRCREETETLAILVGLEIDSAKSGIKPDLTEYLTKITVGRSIFLKYKNLMNEGDEHEWYEKTLRQKLDTYHDSVNWDEVSSNVERLPYLARMLEQNTPKIKPKPATDKELFTFAEKDGWKAAIPKEDMDYMRALIADYEEILKRARLLNIERKTMTHRNDIERILYARGQENTFTTDELYNLFAHYDMDAIAKFREDLTVSEWHLMTEEEREIFLFAHLPLDTPREYFDLFADFRHGGYRVLGDIICDLDDAFQYEETKKHIFERKGDTYHRRLMVTSEKLSGMDYDFKRHIARGCRTAINHEFDRDKALMCAIALGNRKFAFEVLPDMIEKYAKEVPLC